MVEVSTSILAADTISLQSEINSVKTADRIHIDVMDGHFVPNIAFGFPTIKRVTNYSDLPIDIHLMIANPERYLDRLINLNPTSITVHAEAIDDVQLAYENLNGHEIKLGLAVNPETQLNRIEPVADYIDRITIMSVNPGFSGQSFDSNTIERIKVANKKYNCPIEVDGGVDTDVFKACIDAGADILVSGSTIFRSSNREKMIRLLRNGEPSNK
jgi:ribulose-phosphate 3-epimerase